jgi:hypothetical protein
MNEMLEIQLGEVKHKRELKLWHFEPLARGSLLQATIYEKNSQPTNPMPHRHAELLLHSTGPLALDLLKLHSAEPQALGRQAPTLQAS